ncbi:MAG: hypothetical protein K0R26_90 [Bacteroidota bacterium]|nr:hypothetical protein [Bacteroidota bacterium]
MISKGRVYKALIMNDYEGAPYAEWIKTGHKTIETRHRSFTYRGDLIICCGKTNSVSENAGKALCIVDLYKIRDLQKGDEEASGVAVRPGIKAFLFRNWRHFNRDFEFAPQRVSGAWQSIFEIVLPPDIEIIPRPEILPFPEKEE